MTKAAPAQPASNQNNAFMAMKALQETTARRPWSEQLGIDNSWTPTLAMSGGVASSYTLCSATPGARAYSASDIT